MDARFRHVFTKKYNEEKHPSGSTTSEGVAERDMQERTED